MFPHLCCQLCVGDQKCRFHLCAADLSPRPALRKCLGIAGNRSTFNRIDGISRFDRRYSSLVLCRHMDHLGVQYNTRPAK